MHEDELRQLTAHAESETLECKTSTAELDTGMLSACGMLNTGLPGFVFFGVTDGGKVSAVALHAAGSSSENRCDGKSSSNGVSSKSHRRPEGRRKIYFYAW